VWAGILAVVGVTSSPCWAEVGVSRRLGLDVELAVSIVQTIVDDPEPVGIAWARVTPAEVTSRFVLNEQGFQNGDGRPSVLVAAGGTPFVAWARNSTTGYDVVWSRFDASAWTVPEVLAATPSDDLDPVLLSDPADGSIHLLYWTHDGAPRVMHRQLAADLSAWTEPVQVSEPGEIATRPSGVFHNGLLRVTYEIHDQGLGTAPRRIALATRVAEEFFSQTVAVTQHPGPNWPEVHSAGGRMWVDWIDAGGEMAWIRQPAAGQWESVELVPFAGNEERDYHVRGRIAVLAKD
jgi:hypothetical protein